MRHKILLALTLLVLASCAPMSKDRYMARFADFVKEVGMNASNYTEKDWEKQDKMYQKFSDKWYKKFQSEFTTSDKIVLTGYKFKYSYYHGLNKYGSWAIDAINSLDLESSTSAIKSLGDELINGVNQIGGEISTLDGAVNGLLEKLNAAVNQSSSIIESWGDKLIDGGGQQKPGTTESVESLDGLLEKMDLILNQLTDDE